VFFTAMTLAEGGTTTQVKHKLKDMYLPTLKANYILWPAVQILNFRVVPIQFQLVSDTALRRRSGFANSR
jgi:protein Mpv17